MEAIGTAVGLACAVGSVSKVIANFIHTVRLADRDAYLTQRELATLDHLLIQFDQLVSSRDSQAAKLNEETGLQHPVISQGEHLMGEMERVLHKIGMMDKDSLRTRWQRWVSRFRWYIKKKEVLELCVQFNQVKVSVMAFVSMVGLESVREGLKDVRDQLRRLSQEQPPGFEQMVAELQQIRKQLKCRVEALYIEASAARAASKMAAWEVQQQSLLPLARDLSKELDRCVRRVSKILITNESENSSGRQHRRSTSRRTPRRPSSTRGHPANSSGNDVGESAEVPTELPHGQGAYINAQDPQDRRRRLPDGRLSER